MVARPDPDAGELPQPGQIWKNSRSGRVVEVTGIEPEARTGTPWMIRWAALPGQRVRGPGTGQRWYGGWSDAFVFLAHARGDLERRSGGDGGAP